jgi:hypothetical protein
MANISYRLARRESVDKIRDAIAENSVLAESFERAVRHLKANEVDLQREPIAIGPSLTFDQTSEKFVGEFSDRANMLVRRDYREPFVVPERV